MANPIMMAAGSSSSKLYVDDVFSTYPYIGNGSTQTINNGIDLAGNGGLVWVKSRSFNDPHGLFDTTRGIGQRLQSNTTDPQNGTYPLSAISSGFSITSANAFLNSNGTNFVSWTFRKAPKFFDVVTFTTNSGGVRLVAHSLGLRPGMVVVKCTSITEDWYVGHVGSNYVDGNAQYQLKLNTVGSSLGVAYIQDLSATSFMFAGDAGVRTYVAYLFAHDPSADGIIQCGSFTGNAQINLGWEPQYLLVKPSSTTGNWQVFDSLRGWTTDGLVQNLTANTANAENATTTPFRLNATGFQPSLSVTDTYIYLAIRRPNKPPTSGTQVYNAATSDGVKPSYESGFPVDLAIRISDRSSGTHTNYLFDRLRGANSYLQTNSTNSETVNGTLWTFDSNTGFGEDSSDTAKFAWMFRRAPGFFDVVCYTGEGGDTVKNHSLTVVPEMIIAKRRNSTSDWVMASNHMNVFWQRYMKVNTTGSSAIGYELYSPTVSQFTAGSSVDVLNATYVAYLFASSPGISKVGRYTGNGSSQTVDCGFSTGARFILIKRTDAAGDWYVWDTARGIVAANDPHLSLNSTAAEVTTDDSVDPYAAGFTVNQNTATSINVSGASYIFLAIA